MKKGGIIALVVVLLFGAIVFGMYINSTNTEITLREQVVAQDDVCRSNFDKMFKVIAQTAEVPGEFMKQSKEAFKEIYLPIMEGRYSNDRGGALMSWVHEHNPEFDLKAASGMYEQLQRTIEANRQEFFNEQKKLIDIHREHTSYIKRFPARMFVGDVGEIDINIITSDKTEDVYETAKDNDIELF